MSSNKKETNGSLFSTLLFLLFLGLKLCDQINWSWWWVFSPFWVPLLLIGLYLIIYFIFIFPFRKE